MRFRGLNIVVFCTLTKVAFSQVNLISNGSFENYNKLPQSLHISDNIGNYLDEWYTPDNGNTPDYFNYKNPISQIQFPYLTFSPSFIPNHSDSIKVRIIPKDGFGFVGLANSFVNSKTENYTNAYALESITTNTKQSLTKNAKYEGSFFYYVVDGQSIELSDIGMFLHVDSTDIKYRSQNRLRPMYCNNIPQIRNKHGFIRYTGEWERVDGIFKARGGEHKLIIAYFKSDTSIERLDSTKAYIDEANGYFGFKTYFFIDSVTLYEIPCLVAQDTACKGDSVHFYHTFSGNAIWTTNPDSTQHIVGMDSVYSFVADKSGWYYVFTSTGKDSTYLTVIQPPSLTLGMDTFYCKQGNVTLIANGRNMQQYRWQDGSAGNMFTVNKPGWYWLTVSNAGCSATDSVYVTEQPLPEQLTQHQFTICTVTQQYATLALNTNYIYHWQTLTDTFNQITFIQAGCEKVTIESEYGCMTKDEVCIEDVCGVKVFVPNAFVPRGVNATFKPVTKYVSTIHWEVYNRWGERVFAADDLDASWDGTFNGALCNSDVYFYKVTYTDLVNPEPQTIKGNVTLIR